MDGLGTLVVRVPQPGDHLIAFESSGLLSGRVSLAGLLDHHAPGSGQFTLVAEFGVAVVGMAAVSVEGESLHIDFLTRNASAAPPPGLRVGEALVAYIEDMARERKFGSLTLESVDDPRALSFYKRLGFSPSAPPFFEEGWGQLFPLAKHLGRPVG